MENRELLKQKTHRGSRMKKIILTIAGIIFVALVLISGPGCGNQWILFYDKPIKGYVVDTETNSPIEGVLVIAMWDLIGYISHGSDGYAKLVVMKTDKNGTFTIPSWISFKPWKIGSAVNEIAPYILIYKPGYKVYWSNKSMRAGFSGDISITAEERENTKVLNSLTPAKLTRIFSNEEISDSFSNFESDTAGYKYYSKTQLQTIFDAIGNGALLLPNGNSKVRDKILQDVSAYRKYWIEGVR
ncbi:MAG: hypothetical protein C0402_11290 [Thermodesulfovibrio sp.]|nr:hypothetical protein [Thermodesulfovibrio sp.]